MKVHSSISPAILTAATTMLQQYVPELSPKTLVDALKNYSNETAVAPSFEKPLTRKEVASLLNLSCQTVNRMMNRGELRRIHVGMRSVRIDPQSVRDMLEHREA